MDSDYRLLFGVGGWLFCIVSPSPLIPLPSRERGIMVGLDLFTRATRRPVDTALKPVCRAGPSFPRRRE